jgi:hypothetical protein
VSQEPRWSWTQPVCDQCFSTWNPGKTPHRLVEPDEETCVHCGRRHTSGIYIRVDPRYASYPTLQKEP